MAIFGGLGVFFLRPDKTKGLLGNPDSIRAVPFIILPANPHHRDSRGNRDSRRAVPSRLIFIAIVLGAIFLLALLVLGLASVIQGPKMAARAAKAVQQDAAVLGEIDLKDVPHSTFGYLKSTLSPLSVTVGDCRGDHVKYSNCKEASWGHGLVAAIFVNDPGFFAAKDIADVRRAAGIRINSEFRGTLCGKSMHEVMDAYSACGAPVEIEKDLNGSSSIYEGLRRDQQRRNIY